MRYLLDTNVIIAFINKDLNVYDYLLQKGRICISTITLGELYFGAHKSTKTNENMTEINTFVSDCCIVYDIKPETANKYGILRNYLRQKGKPIPENDLWIVATAIDNGLILVSRDKHMLELDCVNSEKW